MPKTKIELKEPYKSLWKSGYVVINKEPRRNLILFNSSKDRTTVPYARYLYETYVGKFLPKNLIVDHIDEDKMNDDIFNYQLITIGENNRKSLNHRNATRRMVKFMCGGCGKVFDKPRNITHLVIKTKKSTYCSRKCSSISTRKPSQILEEYRA